MWSSLRISPIRYGSRGTYTSITRIIYTRPCSGHRIGPVCHTSVCTLSATSSHHISTISDILTSKYKLGGWSTDNIMKTIYQHAMDMDAAKQRASDDISKIIG